MANLIQPRVEGNVIFLIKPDGSWAINIIKDNRVENHAEAKQHGLIVGDNERELDIILDKFQNHRLEVVDGKVGQVKSTTNARRSSSKKPISLDLDSGGSNDNSDSFFD